jgi:hypothetical protein
MAQETYEVQLAIYDLSRGMARNLSTQFLGPQFAIDAIPHTGIVVFGREYFFGGGIQSEEPSLFRRSTGMFPIETRSLGRTTINKMQFEQWCQRVMQNGQYSAAAYDLLSRNCNNFSHDAAISGLGLTIGVPEWVLDVPRRFLSSPMGQMVRPMLENMQLSNVAGAEPVAPFASTGQALSSSSSSSASSAPASTAAPAVANPWTNLNPSSNSAAISTAAAATTTTTTTTTTVKVKDTTSTQSLLDTFTKPLLSCDTKTVGLCTKKLATEDVSDQETLEQANQALSGGSPWSDHLAEKTCRIILRCLAENESNKLTFALLLLRIVVLQSTSEPAISLVHCMEWLQKEITCTADSSVLKSPTARAMAWLTVSNACGCPPLLSVLSLESLVEAAVVDSSLESQPRPEVRQAACAWLYNVALSQSSTAAAAAAQADGTSTTTELSDMVVSMLCACLEGVPTEPDATARLRRLMVVGRILKDTNGSIRGAAKSLVTDLGFEELLVEIAAGMVDQTGDAHKCKRLAQELLQILD